MSNPLTFIELIPMPINFLVPGSMNTARCTARQPSDPSNANCQRSTWGRASATTSATTCDRAPGQIGLLCSDIPEQYGSGGRDFRHEALFCDATSRRDLPGMSPSVHTTVAHYLHAHGTEEQKQHYLPCMVRGIETRRN